MAGASLVASTAVDGRSGPLGERALDDGVPTWRGRPLSRRSAAAAPQVAAGHAVRRLRCPPHNAATMEDDDAMKGERNTKEKAVARLPVTFHAYHDGKSALLLLLDCGATRRPDHLVLSSCGRALRPLHPPIGRAWGHTQRRTGVRANGARGHAAARAAASDEWQRGRPARCLPRALVQCCVVSHVSVCLFVGVSCECDVFSAARGGVWRERSRSRVSGGSRRRRACVRDCRRPRASRGGPRAPPPGGRRPRPAVTAHSLVTAKKNICTPSPGPWPLNYQKR